MAVIGCRDCGVALGELHAIFCTKEQCPFCGGQLASCDCCVSVLGLSDAEREAVEEYVDDSVEPLRGIMNRWVAALEAKGRVRFGSTPPGVRLAAGPASERSCSADHDSSSAFGE